ncbi:MAG: type IV pilus assembly protein PilM [Nitrospinales bacterium]
MFLSEKTPLVAVDIGSYSIKLAQLGRLRNNAYELLSFGMMPLSPESITDGAVKDMDHVVDALARLVKAENIKTRHAVASVSGETVIIKKIKLPIMSSEELSEKIREEAEQYIPFNIDDVSMDYQILKTVDQKTARPDDSDDSDQDLMEVLLVAAQKETIDNRMEILGEAGLKPVIVDLDVFAMMNAAGLSTNLERLGAVALVDLGASFTHINLLYRGDIYFTRDFHIGGVQCTEKLMADLGISFEEANACKKGEIPGKTDKDAVIKVIVESFEPVFEEIKTALESFKNTMGTSVERVLLSGGGALIRGVDGLFADRLDLPVEIQDPLKSVTVNRKKFDLACIAELAPVATVALGLATRRFDYKI